MSSGVLKPTLLGVLVAITVGCMVTLLYLSVDREFVPGAVELSVALVLGVLLGAGGLALSANRHRLAELIEGAGSREFLLLAAGVAVLVASAILSIVFEKFPWPAPLLATVILFYAAIGQARGRANPD